MPTPGIESKPLSQFEIEAQTFRKIKLPESPTTMILTLSNAAIHSSRQCQDRQKNETKQNTTKNKGENVANKNK